jgi:hypothetical protein
MTADVAPAPAASPDHSRPDRSNPGQIERLLPLVQSLAASRRGLLLAPLVAALPFGLMAGSAAAIDSKETAVTLPDQYQ